MGNDDRFQHVVDKVRDRAKNTRRFATLGIGFIVVIAAGMIAFFYYVTSPGVYGTLWYPAIGGSAPAISATPATDEAMKNLIVNLEREIALVRKEIQSQSWFKVDVLYKVSLTIMRLASVVLAVYVIQILVGFTRYHFRVADHLDAVGDALEITRGEPTPLTKVAAAINPQHIDFGKMPKTPTDQTIEILREVRKTIPSK